MKVLLQSQESCDKIRLPAPPTQLVSGRWPRATRDTWPFDMTLLSCFIRHSMPGKVQDGKFCQKLAKVGVHTVEDLMFKFGLATLADKSGVCCMDLVTVYTAVCKQFRHRLKLTSVVDHLTRAKFVLKTGCRVFDDLLPGGGVESGHVTQISGPESSGKTHLCLNLALEAIKTDKKVLYIDTQSAFSATRLVDLISSNGLQKDLANLVDVATLFSVTDLLDLLGLILQTNEYSLLVIDSLQALFDPCFVEMEMQGRTRTAFDLLDEVVRSLGALRLKLPHLVIVVTNYSDKWCQKHWGLTYTLEISLSISKFNPYEIVYLALLKHRNQTKSQYKSCRFIICASGLLPYEPKAQDSISIRNELLHLDECTDRQVSIHEQLLAVHCQKCLSSQELMIGLELLLQQVDWDEPLDTELPMDEINEMSEMEAQMPSSEQSETFEVEEEVLSNEELPLELSCDIKDLLMESAEASSM